MFPTAPIQAHARRDFLDRGVDYLVGDVYPTEGVEPEHLRRLHAACLIEWGPPPDTLAQRAKDRRAALAAQTAPAAASDAAEMTEAELEAATAPSAAQARRGAGRR